jgi:hypothetical protein
MYYDYTNSYYNCIAAIITIALDNAAIFDIK